MELSKQFINKVKWVVDENTNCWNVTTGTPNGEGYIYVSYYPMREKIGPRGGTVGKSKRMGAHRMSYIVFNGEIPVGKTIMHSCDNRSCVNPSHLSIGTKKNNTMDMLSKGRQGGWKGGTRQTLTDDQIQLIKQSELSSYQLAKIYPVSSTQIRRIRNGSRCSSLNGDASKAASPDGQSQRKKAGPVSHITSLCE